MIGVIPIFLAETEPHTCPYREDVHNDHETLCNCSEEVMRECAADI